MKRLTRKIYGDAPDTIRDRLARDHFVDAVNDDEMQWAIIHTKPTGIEDALGSAIEYEAFQQTNTQNTRTSSN